MRKLFAVSTMIALLSGLTAQAVTIQENTVFPAQDIIAGQSQQAEDGTQIMRNEDTLHIGAGQSFTLSGAETLQAITVQMGVGKNKTLDTDDPHEFALWIGSYDDTTVSNHVAGATYLLTSIDIAGLTFSDGNYYTFNLDAPLALPAGDYAFQLYYTTALQGDHRIWWAHNTAGGYAGGESLVQADLPATDGLPFEEVRPADDNDLVFALHSAPVLPPAGNLLTPADLAMFHAIGAGSTTGTVDAVVESDTTIDVMTITISDETHSGAFTVVSAAPQTLTNETTELAFKFDNTIANLAVSETATGLVAIAWEETGGAGSSGTNFMSISALASYPANQVNSFNGDGNGVNWGDADNWNLDRVPGQLGADRGIIQNGASVSVATNFTGAFTYEVTVRSSATLNIAADLKNVDDMNIGSVVDQAATVNQTAGDVVAASLDISKVNNSSNVVYTLSDGSIDVSGNMIIETNGVLRVTGGTATMASGLGGSAVGTDIKAGGLLEVSGGTYVDTSRPGLAAGGTFRIIGDDASLTIHQPTVGFKGTVDFVLDETGVSTLTSDSWGKLHLCNFTIDGSAYTNGGPAAIVLFSSTYHATANNELGSNYSVTGLGTEGVDWTISETNDVTLGRTVTLNILGITEIGDITLGGVDANGDLVLSWDTAVGQSYNVETNSNLTIPSGWGIYETIIGDGSPVSYTNTPVGPQLFYKVTSD